MSNRVKEAVEQPEEQRPAGDYYVVVTRYDTFYVTAETARMLGRRLDRGWPLRPRWIKFVDAAGSRAWVRAEAVESIAESTEHQRQQGRDFQRSLRREEKADRRWDEDEGW